MTNKPDLDQPATVLWVPKIPPTPSEGGEQRDFDTLSEAIRFVTQDLPDRQRATAQIDSQGKSYEVSEVGELVEKG